MDRPDLSEPASPGLIAADTTTPDSEAARTLVRARQVAADCVGEEPAALRIRLRHLNASAALSTSAALQAMLAPQIMGVRLALEEHRGGIAAPKSHAR